MVVLLEILLDSSLSVAHRDETSVLQLHDLLHDGGVLEVLLHRLKHQVRRWRWKRRERWRKGGERV